MEKSVKSFINKIKQSTGIELTIYDENGKFINGYSDAQNVPTNFNGIYADETKNKTFFKITFNGYRLIATISGCSEVEKKFAFLITELAEREVGVSGITKREFHRALINGELSAGQIELVAKRLNIPNAYSSIMLVKTLSGSIDDILEILLHYGGTSHDFAIKTAPDKCALVKFIGSNDAEYRSYVEFAEYLASSVLEEYGAQVKISLGNCAENLSDIAESYSQALSADRMSDLIGLKGNIHSYKDYLLVRVLEQTPESRLKEYYSLLTDEKSKRIFEDAEMIETAEAFLENSLNVSETSRKLYLHRNTLNYRLDKIERGTGLDIRKFTDAVTFRLITVLSKIIKG